MTTIERMRATAEGPSDHRFGCLESKRPARSRSSQERRRGWVEFFHQGYLVPSGLSLCCQVNPFQISQAQHHSPSEELVRDCHRDLIIARFQRQREGAILQRTSPVGKFSRSFLLE